MSVSAGCKHGSRTIRVPAPAPERASEQIYVVPRPEESFAQTAPGHEGSMTTQRERRVPRDSGRGRRFEDVGPSQDIGAIELADLPDPDGFDSPSLYDDSKERSEDEEQHSFQRPKAKHTCSEVGCVRSVGAFQPVDIRRRNSFDADPSAAEVEHVQARGGDCSDAERVEDVGASSPRTTEMGRSNSFNPESRVAEAERFSASGVSEVELEFGQVLRPVRGLRVESDVGEFGFISPSVTRH